MAALQIDGCGRIRGAGEFVMKDDCIGIVNYAQSAFPQSNAVIGVLVVCGFEGFIEATELLPDSPWCQKKCRRAVIHIPPEPVHRLTCIVAAAISQAWSVAPDDAAGFLKAPVQKNQSSADCANFWIALNC